MNSGVWTIFTAVTVVGLQPSKLYNFLPTFSFSILNAVRILAQLFQDLERTNPWAIEFLGASLGDHRCMYTATLNLPLGVDHHGVSGHIVPFV